MDKCPVKVADPVRVSSAGAREEGKTWEEQANPVNPTAPLPALRFHSWLQVPEFRDQIMGPNKLNGAQIRQRSLSTIHTTEALKGQPDI